MPRKTEEVVITAPGRDSGKTFLLTEMDAIRTEKWAARAFLAMTNKDVVIPPEIAAAGMIGIAIMGYKGFAGAQFENVEPLMDEMLGCIQIVQNVPGAARSTTTRPTMASDYEEVSTLLLLRQKILELHAGFTFAAAAEWLKASVDGQPRRRSRTTRTSPDSSEPSSRPDSQR